MAGALLQNGKQQFIDINGKPLVGGLVYFYIPNTLTPKNTWKDAALTILNTNPVVADSRGQAVIYGAGIYRQILKAANGNTIWDQPVSTGGSGGYGQTITVSDSPYTQQAGDSVLFCDVSGGAITINLLAASIFGAQLSIKVKGTATNQVTVTPNGSDVIDGAAYYRLADNNQAITIASDLVSYWGVI
jgi:hypothetical protein